MKYKIKWIVLIVFAAIITYMAIDDILYYQNPVVPDTTYLEVKIETVPINDISDWDRLVDALIKVESENMDSAKNKSGAVGSLQLMPIYIADANRIIGEEKYKLSDRYKRDTSIEIFNIVQDHYNPTHNIIRAIKLHNPNAGKWYYNRVIKELNKIRLWKEKY